MPPSRLVVLGLICLVACSREAALVRDAGPGEACRSGEDCREGLVCLASACRQTCTLSSDCPQGQSCGGGICDTDPPLELGASCTDAGRCRSGLCVDGVCCATPCDGPCMACGGSGACDVVPPADDACAAIDCPADTACRDYHDATVGGCNALGICKDASDCAYTDAPASVVCRPASGDCDVAETCDGAGTCPLDLKLGDAIACRPAAHSCDVAEVCDGVGGACPADALSADGAGCAGDGVCGGGACCGDGDVSGAEECDDGNRAARDGCSPACELEPAQVSCKEWQSTGVVADGVQLIDPDGTGGAPAFDAYCDMTSHGGGWTLVANISAANKNHGSTSAAFDVNGNGLVDHEHLGEKLSDATITQLFTDRLWVQIVSGSGDIHCARANQTGKYLEFSITHSQVCGYTYDAPTGAPAQDGAVGPTAWLNYDYRAYLNPYSTPGTCGGAVATNTGSCGGTGCGEYGCSVHLSRDGWLWVR